MVPEDGELAPRQLGQFLRSKDVAWGWCSLVDLLFLCGLLKCVLHVFMVLSDVNKYSRLTRITDHPQNSVLALYVFLFVSVPSGTLPPLKGTVFSF